MESDSSQSLPPIPVVPEDWRPSGLQAAASLIGLPVPVGGNKRTIGEPGLTFFFFVLMFFGTAIESLFEREVDMTLGFIPATAKDVLFFTSLSSTFIHGGWIHFFGNAYFLLICCPGVEARLGVIRTLALFLGGGFMGDILTYATDPRGTVTYIGASGAIASILIYSLLTFRDRRFGVFAFGSWVTLAPIWLVLYFIGIQILGILTTSNDERTIGYFSHLGGMAVGIFTWAIQKKWPSGSRNIT